MYHLTFFVIDYIGRGELRSPAVRRDYGYAITPLSLRDISSPNKEFSPISTTHLKQIKHNKKSRHNIDSHLHER